jgi:acyl-CoA synthetase (AMP-forming)/AMP-acid ligase II/acyl carrier protein
LVTGDRVVLLFDNARWTDYAVALLGVHKAGAVAVPLGSRFSGPELAEVLRHCEPAGMVGPEDLTTAGLTGWTLTVAALEEGRSTDAVSVPVGPDDLAEILYTSGTTGRPKGVACTHANVAFHDPPPEGPRPGGGRATFVHAFPVGTNAGQEVLRFPLRRDGRTAIAMPVFDPERLCALIAEHGVRNLQLVPAMARLILESGAYERHDVSSVERVTLSSAPTPPAVLEGLAAAFPNATLWNTYALTEAGTARTLMVVDGSHAGSVGRPVGETRVRIADDAGREVATGEVGEVWIGRPGAPTRFYYRDPEATAEVFVGDWVKTGDLGFLDADGYLHLTDRKKDIIISGGLNVWSVEVENALYDHPAVAEAAVFGVPHPVLGQDVAAAVVLRSEASERDLQSFVRGRLAEHKTPHRVVVVDELPRNPSGKVLKRDLRERFGAALGEGGGEGDGAPGVPFAAPGTEVETRLAAIWAEVLGRDRVGLDDDFFELGGHSLAATQVAARVKDALGIEVPVDAVFDHPTVAELARTIEELAGT